MIEVKIRARQGRKRSGLLDVACDLWLTTVLRRSLDMERMMVGLQSEKS